MVEPGSSKARARPRAAQGPHRLPLPHLELWTECSRDRVSGNRPERKRKKKREDTGAHSATSYSW